MKTFFDNLNGFNGIFCLNKQVCMLPTATIAIDNNTVANSIRPIAIARRNYLLADFHTAA